MTSRHSTIYGASAVLLLVSLTTTLSGCFPLMPGATTLLLKKQAPPPKIEVTDFDLPFVGDATRAAWWSEEPTWGEVTRFRRDGDWYLTRISTNTPMIYVWVDLAIGGNDCRWASMQMEQTQEARGSSDDEISASETSINTHYVDHQYTWPCSKLRAMIADDPKYKSVMEKE